MDFPYMYTLQPMDSIDVDEIGKVCLNALSDDGSEYYLSITTSLGWTKIIEFGPLVADDDEIPSSFNFNYKSVEYNEGKLKKAIDNFINNPHRNITQVFEIEDEEVEQRLKNLKMSKEE